MASILTELNRTSRAINFRYSNLYLALGRTTAWPDEENPPTPLITMTEIEEFIFLKKFIFKKVMKEITYDNIVLINIDGTFEVDEEIEGGTSGATATILSIDGSQLNLTLISGTFVLDEEVTGGTSSATGDIDDIEISSFEVAGVKYVEVTDEKAYDEDIRLVVLEAEVNWTDIIGTSLDYRQVGVVEDPKYEGVILDGMLYLAAAVDDQGILHYVNNIVAVHRDPAQIERIVIMVEY